MSRTLSWVKEIMTSKNEAIQAPDIEEDKELRKNDKGGGDKTGNDCFHKEQDEELSQAIKDSLTIGDETSYNSSSEDRKKTDNLPPDENDARHFGSTKTVPPDENDARHFGSTKTVPERPNAEMPVGRHSTHYNMKHKRRGFAVIIAYSEFARGGPGPRNCAKHDVDICTAAFKKLHYDIRTYMNLTKSDFLKLLEMVSNADHSSCDSLVIVFMSHGGIHEKNKQEFIWTYDTEVNTSELWKNLTPQKCPSLAGKPKLFFIQACRGEDTDKGIQLKKKPLGLTVFTDSISEDDYAIPMHADLLMMWASYPGMFAFKSRNNGVKGSVFLHYLAKVLLEDAHNDDLMSMLVRVTREVAIHYESYVPGDALLDKNKQIPQIVSTLMRKVKFL